MEDKEKFLPNGSDFELVDASAKERHSFPPQNPSHIAELPVIAGCHDDGTEAPQLPVCDDKAPMDDGCGSEHSKANGGSDAAGLVVEPPPETERKAATDAAASLGQPPQESQGNGCDARAQNQLAPASPPSPEKFSTPKATGKIAVVPKNGFDDVEMAEAEEESGSPEDGTPAQQAAFMKELENFHREKALEFKPPKFYGELLNCLKLWRAVIRLGGYDVVTASKLWRQVGESFHPPKTCTTVSWTFRIFYEKALLEYEKHKRQIGELQLPVGSFLQPTSVEKEASSYQAQGSGRARRDAAARAMQGWHVQRLLGYGEVAEPIIKDKNTNSASKREKNLKSIGSLKHKTATNLEQTEKTSTIAADKQVVATVVDVGPPADWVKINVRETKDCFEVYALVPGLLREEVRVQSDPAGRLVITGQPEQLDNPWGITPFQKVVSLPARIDPLHTSAVVSLHGRLFVRVPFEQGSV